MPPNLDINLIINIALILYNTQHAYGIANAINFWYTYYDLLPTLEKKDYTKIITTSFFYCLFLHWSKNVREIFYHFLCYRLLFWYETSSDPSIEKIIILINENVNYVELAANAYQRDMFKWDQALHTKQKHVSYCSLMKSVMEKVREALIPIIDVRNVFESPKLTKNLKDAQRRSSMVSDINYDADYIVEFHTGDTVGTKTRMYKKSRIKMSRITQCELPYCKKALDEFREVVRHYRQDFDKFKKNPSANLPILSFKLPIDKFEVMESDENRW